MDAKTKALLTRLFIADADGSGWYDESSVCTIIGELRTHLESTGEFDWKRDAEPMLNAEESSHE